MMPHGKMAANEMAVEAIVMRERFEAKYKMEIWCFLFLLNGLKDGSIEDGGREEGGREYSARGYDDGIVVLGRKQGNARAMYLS